MTLEHLIPHSAPKPSTPVSPAAEAQVLAKPVTTANPNHKQVLSPFVGTFYRKPSPDAVVTELIEKLTAGAGIVRREISKEEIIERTIYALANEGARILEEGIALRPVDIDIIYLTGYGFPAYRGGPMFYVDTVGLDKVYARICEFQVQHGELWEPAPLLAELAKAGKTFGQWAKERE